jgi:hypothetical protein
MNIELFDPEMVKSKQPKYSLWRFFNKDDELLYVSQKPNPAILMTKKWWFDTHHIMVEHFSSYDELLDAKAAAISNEDPKWNWFKGQ